MTTEKIEGITAGEEIVLSVTTDEAYELNDLKIVKQNNKDVALVSIKKGVSYKFSMPNSDVTIVSSFQKMLLEIETVDSEGNTTYRIEHYLQSVDGNDTYELSAIQEKRGNAGDITSAIPKNYSGFTALYVEQQEIEEDESTLIKIYYNRNKITYCLDPNGGEWNGNTEKFEISGLYGSFTNLQKPTRVGYNLCMEKSLPTVFGVENELFTANWDPRTDTKYCVRVFIQDYKGNYVLESEYEKEGTTDTLTNIIFGDNREYLDLKPYDQININADGSGILNVFYDRETYTYHFDSVGGSPVENRDVVWYGKLKLPEPPAKPGYTFLDWYIDSEYNTVFDPNLHIARGDKDITLYACWLDNSISYNFHNQIEKLPIGTDGTAGTTGEYILFGDYPQSKKTNDVIIDYDKTYIIGGIEYNKGNDGELYAFGTYKMEPIKWRVMSKDENGKAILLAENILYHVPSFYYRKHLFQSNGIVYFYGDIEPIYSLLNEDFMFGAFTLSARELLLESNFSLENRHSINYGIYDFHYSLSKYKVDLFTVVPELFIYNESSLINRSKTRKPTDYSQSISEIWAIRNNESLGLIFERTEEIGFMEDSQEAYDYYYALLTSNQAGVVPSITVYLE